MNDPLMIAVFLNFRFYVKPNIWLFITGTNALIAVSKTYLNIFKT